MAISDSDKVDFLWKRSIYGVTKTAASSAKTASNEIYASPSAVVPSQVWRDAVSLPVPAPAASDDLVSIYYGANAVQMTPDPTSAPNETWLATAFPGNLQTIITGWIPQSVDASYAVQVFIGNPHTGPAARIFPDTVGEEYVFDYNAGVLIFDNAVPSNKTATVGSGTVGVAANGIYIQAYHYYGRTGLGAAADDATELTLGSVSGTAAGAVVLSPSMPVTEAIEAINEALAVEVAAREGAALTQAQITAIETAAAQQAETALENSGGTVLALGEDAPSSPGAIALSSTTKITDAIFGLNEALAVETAAREGATLTQAQITAIETAAAQQAETALENSGATVLKIGEDDPYAGQIAIQHDHTIADVLFGLNGALAEVAADLASAGAQDGFSLPLGSVETKGDGSWAGGAVALTDTTKVSNAIDQMNTILGKLVPSAPPAFPNGVNLAVSNTAGSTPLLCSGVTDNSGKAPYAAGAAVTRITAAGPSSNTFATMGPGNAGTLQALINDTVVASHALAGTSDNGSYSGLVISAQADYPSATPGFWKSISVALNLVAAPVGVNLVKINDTAAGATADVPFVRDATTAIPALSAMSVTQKTAGTLAYSSGVPHYGTGGQLTVNASVSQLSGETYYGGTDPLTGEITNGGSTAQTFGYGALGVATPIPRQTTAAAALNPITLNVDGANAHTKGLVQLNAKNVNGATGLTNANASLSILVKAGTAQAAEIDENSVSVSGLGASPNASNAARVSITADGATPSGAAAAWDSTKALAGYEASVVGGVLAYDQTNYTTGYLPAGPNLSGRETTQYATFAFDRAAVSAFKISVTGTYAGVEVKLPGVTDQASISPNAPNGWMNAFAAYTGAGVPGNSSDTSAGCALGAVMNGTSGTFQVTFGTQSSTNATGNQILVRFALTAGQSITALSFTN